MQQHDTLPRTIGEAGVAVELGARRAIEIAELAHVVLHAALAYVEQVLDEHAERRAPIADVVLPNDVVPRELEQPRERVADDRRAQMPDVHLLRDVRRRVVDDDAFFVDGARDAEALVACDVLQCALEERRL